MLEPFDGELASGPVRLKFDSMVSFEPGGQKVPYYHFKIHNDHEDEVGFINFRVGGTRHVNLVAGHVGYEVHEAFRGHSYSYHACVALKPLLRKHYDMVLITVDPDNAPSIRIIEKLGARFLNEVEVPSDDPAYANGARRKRRYEWVV